MISAAIGDILSELALIVSQFPLTLDCQEDIYLHNYAYHSLRKPIFSIHITTRFSLSFDISE